MSISEAGPRTLPSLPLLSKTQARREPQRGPGNHYHGPYPNLIPNAPRSRRRSGVDLRGRKRGVVGGCPHLTAIGCPLTIRLGVWGSVVSSPSGIRAEHRPKMDLMHIWGQKDTIWNILCSIFERCPPPPPKKKVTGPGKTFPPFPSLLTGMLKHEAQLLLRDRTTRKQASFWDTIDVEYVVTEVLFSVVTSPAGGSGVL